MENIESCSSFVDKYNFLSEFSPSSTIHCELVQNYIQRYLSEHSSKKSIIIQQNINIFQFMNCLFTSENVLHHKEQDCQSLRDAKASRQ